MTHRSQSFHGLLAALLASTLFGFTASPATAAPESAAGPFRDILGWWIGNGRLGFKDGKRETVKCRATYRWDESNLQLLQAIRCASPSGKVEIVGNVRETGGELRGTWAEKTYELSGELSGNVFPGGFRVKVAGDQVNASMTVFLKDGRQFVEIQFHEGTLLGLTLVLTRG